MSKAMIRKPAEVGVVEKKFDFEDLTIHEKRLMLYLEDKQGLSHEDAIDLIADQVKWDKFIATLKKQTDLKNVEIIEKAQIKVKEKIDAGSLGNAKEGTTIIAILRDKVFGTPVGAPTFQFGGKDVKVNVNFPFKPYRSR